MDDLKKWSKIMMLLSEVNDPMVEQFFDVDSMEMLDTKIEVLTQLKSGTPPGDIPAYEKILELKDDNTHWDI